MFRKAKNFLKSKRKATGGLTFIMIATIGAITMSYLTRISSEDLAKSMANSSAYFATFRAATYLYNAHMPSGSYTTVSDTRNGVNINMSSDYRNLVTNTFPNHYRNISGTFVVRWDRDTSTATTTSIPTILPNFNGTTVHADKQVVVIE